MCGLDIFDRDELWRVVPIKLFFQNLTYDMNFDGLFLYNLTYESVIYKSL